MWITSALVVAVIVNICTVINAQLSTDISSVKEDDNTEIYGSPTTHSDDYEMGQTAGRSTDYDSNSETSTSGYNISGTGIDTTLQHHDNAETYATVFDNNSDDIQETSTFTDEQPDERDNADTNDPGLTTTIGIPAISTTQDGNFDLQVTVIDTAGTSTGNSNLSYMSTGTDDSGNSVTNEVNTVIDENDSTASGESFEYNDSGATENALELPTNDPVIEITENILTTESGLATEDNGNYPDTTFMSRTSDNYITNSPLPTNYPNGDQSDENGNTVTGINTDEDNSTNFTSIVNNETTGQISSEQPAKTVTAENGNNIVTSSPSVGANPSTSDSGSYDVTDINGQDFAQPNGKPITSASAWMYGFLVTIADGSVFTATEFIGGQPTTSSNENSTTLSNDSSDSATENPENNTEGLVTDGAVEFPTTGSFENTNTNYSTITEISVIANNSVTSEQDNTETAEESQEKEDIFSTVSSAFDSYDNTVTSNANTDDYVFTATEYIGGQPTTNSNEDTATVSNESSDSATENNTAELVTDGAIEFPTTGSFENANTDYSTITEISVIANNSVTIAQDNTESSGGSQEYENIFSTVSSAIDSYDNTVTLNADDYVFTATEFIGEQQTTNSNEDTTTVSNDSTDSATETLENNTEGLITDGAVEFPTTGSFENVNTDYSTITEISVIANNTVTSEEDNTETAEESQGKEDIFSTVSSAIDSYDNTVTLNANADDYVFTATEFIGEQQTTSFNEDTTTLSNDTSDSATENNSAELVTDGAVEFPTTGSFENANTNYSTITEISVIANNNVTSEQDNTETAEESQEKEDIFITVSSAFDSYDNIVTLNANADDYVFTATEFIGEQQTTNSNEDTTTVSNDSSDSATETVENNTEGLITDGAVEFPTTGSFENAYTDYSTIAELSVIANNTVTIVQENTETPEGSQVNEAIFSTISSVIDSYDNTVTSNANNDGSTQLPNDNWSTVSFTQRSVDIFHIFADKQSEMNPITRGTCGLLKGGPMIQQAVPPVTSLSRGLAWSTENRALYFADVFKPAVSQYTPQTGRVVTLNLDGNVVNTIIPTSTKHQFVVALDHRLVLLQNSFTKDENITIYKKVLVQFNAIHSLGVAKTDLQGRLWIPVRVKTSNDGIIDKLYVINGGKVEYKDTFRKNYGMAWSADNKYFYVADSEWRTGYIYVYDFERKDGSIKNRKILFNKNNYPELTGHILDIVVDRNGNIWASIYKNSLVIKIDHATGNILEMIALPTYYPVSLAFGNGKQDKLFVGTSYHSSRKMDAPYTYGISKLGVTGISATKKVQLNKIFGSTTINVPAFSADDQAPPSDPTPTNSNINETCEINKDLLQIRDRNTGACTIVKDKPILQEAIAPLETNVEGLHWDYSTNAMYLADAYVPALIKYTPYNGKTITVKFQNTTTITAIVPIRNKHHNYIISAGHSLVQFENRFSENTAKELNGPVIATLKGKDANLIFSRGRTDSQGRLWIGTRFTQPTRRKCSLYMLQRGKLISKITKVIDSGGMTWSLNKKIFYFADAGLEKIYSYDYNARTGSIRNRKIFFDIKSEPNLNGTVTDILIDNKDNIWASVYGGSVVICINSKTAAVTQMISLPIKYPVSLEFGGIKRDTLYVSGANRDTCKIEGMPYTYAISNMGVRGTSANYYYTL